MKLSFILAAVWSLVLVTPAWSASLTTYVDATDGPSGNTSLAAGGVFNPPRNTIPIDNDNNWTNRTFGNNGTVFTSNDFGRENAPGLVTLVSGLVPGTSYDMYAYLWVDSMSSSNWRLKASLTQMPPLDDSLAVSYGARATSNSTVAVIPANTSFVSLPLLFEGNRTFLEASLGRAAADSNGTIRVWIDDYSNVDAITSNRTWYDGVGYAQVPEPSSCILAALCLSVFASRRRAGDCAACC